MQLRKFEAGDFLNIFLRFLDFWASFSHKKFFMPKNSLYLQISLLFSIVWRRGKGIEFLLNFGTNNLIIVSAFGSTVVFVSKYLLKCFYLLFDFGMFKKCHVFFNFFVVRIFVDHCLKTLFLIMIDFIW